MEISVWGCFPHSDPLKTFVASNSPLWSEVTIRFRTDQRFCTEAWMPIVDVQSYVETKKTNRFRKILHFLCFFSIFKTSCHLVFLFFLSVSDGNRWGFRNWILWGRWSSGGCETWFDSDGSAQCTTVPGCHGGCEMWSPWLNTDILKPYQMYHISRVHDCNMCFVTQPLLWCVWGKAFLLQNQHNYPTFTFWFFPICHAVKWCLPTMST